MVFKFVAISALGIAVGITPPGKAYADGGDFAAGIVTGVIGSAIVRDINRTNKKKTYRRTTNTYQRQQNRDVQTSLNYFGFPAGTPDGVLGRNSRSAISQYQIFMGYPATGYLTDVERGFLVTSYQRAIAGGAATTQMVATNPQGTRGLLLNFRSQNSIVQGMVPTQPQTTVVVTQPAQTVVTPQTEATMVSAPAEEPASALPSFMGAAGAPQSLASHCNKVSLLSNSNGGITQVSASSGASPELILSEQFCLARTYAIAQGEELSASVQGVTPAQIAQQCEGLAPAMKDLVSAASLNPQVDVSRQVSAFILESGMSPSQLSGTARICLSVGYRTDNMDVALSSSLILFALGEQVYGELLGHHLSQGFGTTQRMDLAISWYDPAFAAMDSGATPLVTAAAVPERVAMLRQATARAQGGLPASNGGATSVKASTALPSFNVAQ
jgi:peptidoglycan hydrolase-like protein with peptidoglycan-binding domain